MGVVVKYLPISVLTGILCYLSFLLLLSTQRNDGVTSIPSEIHKTVRQSYNKMLGNQFEKCVKADILGCEKLIFITDSFRSAEYGFIKNQEPCTHFFAMIDGKYSVYHYDNGTWFVILNKKFALSLEEIK